MKQKLLAVLLACATAMAAFAGCAKDVQDENASNDNSSSVEESSQEEFVPTKVETLYDPAFSIELLEDGIKKVTDGENRELILVPKELEAVPEEYAESTVIRTPVEKAVFLSSTQVCSFRELGKTDAVKAIAGVSGGAGTWGDLDFIEAGLADGSIVDVGGGMGDPDYELIQSLEPELVFVYTGSSPQTSQIAKLEELGINYAVDNEYMESNYMARMEWMRFVLTFFNADDKVEEIMKAAQADIEAAKAKTAGLDKPKAAIFSVFDGTVYATSDNSWVGSMLADMGGVNVFSDMPEGALTVEAAFEKVQDADLIIYTSTPTWCSGIAGIKEAFPQLEDCKAFANGNVYQYGEPFWNGIDQTNVIAGDLAAALYPEQFADREMVYYVKAQ